MQDDLKEFLESLLKHKVKFLIAGAHALAAHGRPRFTEDLDVFLSKDPLNKQKLFDALSDFGIPITQEAIAYLFDSPKEMIVLGNPPNQVDLLNFLTGLKFDEAWENRIQTEVLGVSVQILSKEDYIKTKKATGRPKDLIDLALLQELDEA